MIFLRHQIDKAILEIRFRPFQIAQRLFLKPGPQFPLPKAILAILRLFQKSSEPFNQLGFDPF